MLAHNLKEILTLAPEAMQFVKQASLEQEFPIDNKDSVCASYLRVNYLTKVANKKVDKETEDLITKAAMLYDVKPKLDQIVNTSFAPKLEKTASEKAGDLLAELVTSVDGFMSIEKTASLAERIQDEFPDHTNELVDRYSGNSYLNKQAAFLTLGNRYHATKDESFIKVAQLVDTLKDHNPSINRQICQTVSQLDKQAGLDVIGFNFYKEAMVSKKAAMGSISMVNLAGTQVPFEKITRLGNERISSLIGGDVSKELKGCPVGDKYVLEALSRDLQLILVAALKGV